MKQIVLQFSKNNIVKKLQCQHVYLYIYVCMSVYIYIYIYIYIHIHTHVCVCVCVSVCVCSSSACNVYAVINAAISRLFMLNSYPTRNNQLSKFASSLTYL